MANCADNSYNVHHTNPEQGVIQIKKSALITDLKDIALIGKTRREYGEIFNENILHILERFAVQEDAANPGNPDLAATTGELLENPTIGQLWLNKTTNTPFIFASDRTWIELATLDYAAGNAGVMSHGFNLPLPMGQDGYGFDIEECVWTVSPFHVTERVDFIRCYADANARVVMEYRIDGESTLRTGLANYQILGIRYNTNNGSGETATCSNEPRPLISPTPSPTRTVTPTRTPTGTPVGTPAVTPTMSASPTLTPAVTVTRTPASTPGSTPAVTPTISVTPSGTPAATPASTPGSTPPVTPTSAASQTPAASNTPAASPASTPGVTVTRTPAVTPTRTPAVTVTRTPGSTPPVTPTSAASPTPAPSSTPPSTPAVTPTSAASPTPAPSSTPSSTPQPVITICECEARVPVSGGFITSRGNFATLTECELNKPGVDTASYDCIQSMGSSNCWQLYRMGDEVFVACGGLD